MSRCWTDEQRKALSETQKKNWVCRKEQRREMATIRAERYFAETQLEQFDNLPQCERITRFVKIAKLLMEQGESS